MSSPRNTSKTDPLLLLADAMGPGGPSASIERMEAQGQREIVNSTVLPSRLNYGTEDELTALGFKLGDKVAGDPLFRHAELPTGWKREGSDHAMWSYLVDELGRRRVSVFYKAAFYDRDAFLNVNTVYGYIGECISEKRTPVLDEVWATRKAVHAAAVGQIAQCAKYLGMYDDRDDEYGRERAAELRSEIAAAQALIDSLTAQDGAA
ncbi:hypothetical protein [Nonomuraea wenchangensis]|uniref:Uncharacterized protein n=1 Tax=Nonomuraea wenchangensis TaxID=568860 RepID=A0A1I0F3W4_9ACTN|nr:hypothetical protein [Nonomuraea wenchangensis]SET51723.1 hypothetical protein SAMN05421811_103285 [Nonomuraea wenchangensis]